VILPHVAPVQIPRLGATLRDIRELAPALRARALMLSIDVVHTQILGRTRPDVDLCRAPRPREPRPRPALNFGVFAAGELRGAWGLYEIELDPVARRGPTRMRASPFPGVPAFEGRTLAETWVEVLLALLTTTLETADGSDAGLELIGWRFPVQRGHEWRMTAPGEVCEELFERVLARGWWCQMRTDGALLSISRLEPRGFRGDGPT